MDGHGWTGKRRLTEAVEAFDYLARKDLLHKESGIHKFNRLKFQL